MYLILLERYAKYPSQLNFAAGVKMVYGFYSEQNETIWSLPSAQISREISK